MRIAITARGSGPDSPADGRFLAASYILIHDTFAGRWDSVINALGRGKKGKERVRLLKQAGVEALITGCIDPVSFKELSRLGIRVYETPGCSAGEAAGRLVAGQLAALQFPDAIDITRIAPRNLLEGYKGE